MSGIIGDTDVFGNGSGIVQPIGISALLGGMRPAPAFDKFGLPSQLERPC